MLNTVDLVQGMIVEFYTNRMMVTSVVKNASDIGWDVTLCDDNQLSLTLWQVLDNEDWILA
jgi:hypothetical protein